MWIIWQGAIIIKAPIDEWNDFRKCASEAILQQLHKGTKGDWHYLPFARSNTDSITNSLSVSLRAPTSPLLAFQGSVRPDLADGEKMPKPSVDHSFERSPALQL